MKIKENIPGDIWAYSCDMIKTFENMMGIIIVPTSSNQKIVNQISFNAGFKWFNHKVTYHKGNVNCLTVNDFLIVKLLCEFME